MTNVTSGLARNAAPPAWPTVMLALLCVLATLSLCQGVVDVVLPVMLGEAPFQFLFEQTARFGPGFLVGYIFLHNLGLACVVPGYGFLAAWFERRTTNRFLIGVLLAASVAVSLFGTLQFVLEASEMFNLPTALAIFFAESAAVLAVAVAGARELRGFIPTRRYEWSLVTPFRNLGVPLAYAVTVLLAVSLFEAWTILGA